MNVNSCEELAVHHDLFVGESAPDSGKLFYSSDSSLFTHEASVWKRNFLEDFKEGFLL